MTAATRRTLGSLAIRQRRATVERDRAIRDAVADGASLRAVAEAVSLSHSAIDKIVKRARETTS